MEGNRRQIRASWTGVPFSRCSRRGRYGRVTSMIYETKLADQSSHIRCHIHAKLLFDKWRRVNCLSRRRVPIFLLFVFFTFFFDFFKVLFLLWKRDCSPVCGPLPFMLLFFSIFISFFISHCQYFFFFAWFLFFVILIFAPPVGLFSYFFSFLHFFISVHPIHAFPFPLPPPPPPPARAFFPLISSAFSSLYI